MSHDFLMRTALDLASRGMHVFPLQPDAKVPAISRDWEGCATIDVDQIERWWVRVPYNIGVACGPSRLLVVDLDAPKPQAGSPSPGPHGRVVLGRLARKNGGTVPRDTFTVSTAGGGQHVYFRPPDGVILHNTAGRLGVHVDTRATGGYVVGPGSTIAGRRYRVAVAADPAPLPPWLLAALQTASIPSPRPRSEQIRGSSAYVGAALRGEAERVADAPVGQRNNTLYKAAARLSRFVAEGSITDADVQATLEAASSRHIGIEGYTARQVRQTIRSGLRQGHRARDHPTHARTGLHLGIRR